MRTTAALFLLLACPTAALAYGETDADGHPNGEERLLLVLTNQIRQAPHAWPGWDIRKDTATARLPLASDPSLFTAARFHGDDLAASNTFQHESSDGTSFEARMQRYWAGGGAGENIYMASFTGARAAMTAWMNSDGHRVNILRPGWTHLGTGYTAAAGRYYYVQDFGQRGSTAPPTIPAAALSAPGGAQLGLHLNFYDPSFLPAKRVVAAVGQTCVALEAVAGEPGNQTYEAKVPNPAEGTAVAFYAETEAGARTRYPTTGVLMVSSSGLGGFEAEGNVAGCDFGIEPAPAKGGCTTTGEAAGPLALLGVLGLARSTRRGPPRVASGLAPRRPRDKAAGPR